MEKPTEKKLVSVFSDKGLPTFAKATTVRKTQDFIKVVQIPIPQKK
jgi:hypothetical protein